MKKKELILAFVAGLAGSAVYDHLLRPASALATPVSHHPTSYFAKSFSVVDDEGKIKATFGTGGRGAKLEFYNDKGAAVWKAP